jgi:hypothetical protein
VILMVGIKIFLVKFGCAPVLAFWWVDSVCTDSEVMILCKPEIKFSGFVNLFKHVLRSRFDLDLVAVMKVKLNLPSDKYWRRAMSRSV